MWEKEDTERNYYTVSEAVQKIRIPSHVLRYWEDELGLSIGRSAQGHRIYREEDLATFERVKELKEKGIQLKAIRVLLESSGEAPEFTQLLQPDGQEREEKKAEKGILFSDEEECERKDACSDGAEYEVIPAAEAGTYQRFEFMLRSLVSEAVAEQNEKLEHVLTEVIRDELEDLYLQLLQEEGRREAAAAKEKPMPGRSTESIWKRLRTLIGRN